MRGPLFYSRESTLRRALAIGGGRPPGSLPQAVSRGGRAWIGAKHLRPAEEEEEEEEGEGEGKEKGKRRKLASARRTCVRQRVGVNTLESIRRKGEEEGGRDKGDVFRIAMACV